MFTSALPVLDYEPPDFRMGRSGSMVEVEVEGAEPSDSDGAGRGAGIVALCVGYGNGSRRTFPDRGNGMTQGCAKPGGVPVSLADSARARR
jgi:hypothetical protein